MKSKQKLSYPKRFLTVFLGIIAVSTLLASMILTSQSTTPATGPYYLSVPAGTWSYLIDKFSNGSYYMVNGSNWHVDYQSSNASQVINFALGNLTSGRTWQEKVLLKGDFSLSETILLYSETYLQIIGYITWSGGADNMIENGNSATMSNNVVVDGGFWDGNSAANHVVYWIQNTEMPNSRRGVIFRNMDVRDCLQSGIYIHPIGGQHSFEIDNCRTCGHMDQDGMYLEGVSELLIHDIQETQADSHATGDYYSLKLVHCAAGVVSTCHFDDGIFLETHEICFSNIQLDVSGDPSDSPAITLDGCSDCTFSNIRCYIQLSDGYTTQTAILMQNSVRDGTYSAHNTLTDIVIGRRYGATGTNRYGYGIKETGNSDYNIYTCINAYDTVTAGIVTVGANSTANHCWNGTSWLS